MITMKDLEVLKNKIGDKVAISGNVTPVDVFRNGTPELIEKEIYNCIKKASDSPNGFTLCPGCTTPVGTPRENIIAFMNAAYKYGYGAKKGQMCKGIKK